LFVKEARHAWGGWIIVVVINKTHHGRCHIATLQSSRVPTQVRKKREKEKNNYIEKKKRWGPKGGRKEGSTVERIEEEKRK